MVAESLIRALELRMDNVPAARAKESVDTFYRAGLLLTPYFYSALDGYERADVSLRDSFLQMAPQYPVKDRRSAISGYVLENSGSSEVRGASRSAAATAGARSRIPVGDLLKAGPNRLQCRRHG